MTEHKFACLGQSFVLDKHEWMVYHLNPFAIDKKELIQD